MKSRSIAGDAAAAAAESTGTDGIGPGAGGATGAEPIDVVDAELSKGDGRDAVAAPGDEVGEAANADSSDAVGAKVGGIG
jgi:hypothetical protein